MNTLVCTLKNFVDGLSSAFTCIGIVVAGIWTYLLFVRQRLNVPRAVPELRCAHFLVDGSRRLVHVELRIANAGQTLIRPTFGEIRLRQVLPLQDGVLRNVPATVDALQPERNSVEWPLLCARKWTWVNGDLEIEPNEVDSFQADFVIDALVTQIQIYAFVENSTKKKKWRFGWTESTFVQLTPTRDGEQHGGTKA